MRILFVAMTQSIHTTRWVNQLAGQGWDIHLFPVEDRGVHPDLRDVTVQGWMRKAPRGLDPSVRLAGPWWRLPRGLGLARRVLRCDRPSYPAERLARVIRKVHPDLVHSLEFQHAGYLTLAAREILGGDFPKWAVSNWGSDIYLYGRLKEHVERIKAILSGCDFYFCECQRDVKLARDMGLNGEAMPVLPNTGGFDIARVRDLRSSGPTSARRLILLKGYQGWAGRAFVGLRAIALAARDLAGYRVGVYAAEDDVKLAAELVSASTGIPIETMPRCSHEEMLRLFGQARVYMGLSISDAISTSLLEAMVMGAFPIQSNTSAANEWVADGETGLIVPPEDPEPVAAAIRRAVTDDALVDRAAELNWKTATERLDGEKIRRTVVGLYQDILNRN